MVAPIFIFGPDVYKRQDIHLKNHATFAAFLGVNYVLDWAGSIALNRMVEEVQPDLMLVLGEDVYKRQHFEQCKKRSKGLSHDHPDD